MLNPRVASRCNNQLCKIKISKLERKLQSYESGEMFKRLKEELDEARRSVKYYQGQIKNLQDEIFIMKIKICRIALPIRSLE